ncbi:MAG TPA: hypothetical protein VMF50_12460 [Candidatus Binataceae bacterium]|nr:hypothetical protein [Candidatus Binataceae bacterium]
MSILDQIKEHVGSGRLFALYPSNEIRANQVPLSKRRQLYVTPQIEAFIKSNRHLAAETEQDLDEIMLGERFDVALESNHQYCRMARLLPAIEEVWEIRIYDTTPQLRLFGRFAYRDVFVALIGPIGRIKRTLNWKGIKRQCIKDWQGLFTYSPVSNGDDIDDYLTNVDLV